MQYGMTYMVRPFIAPSNSLRSLSYMTFGSSQLLVGPASSFLREQMNVRPSTRATSLTAVLCNRQPGSFSGLRASISPVASAWSRSSLSCASLPSIQTTLSGSTSAFISSIQLRTFLLLVMLLLLSMYLERFLKRYKKNGKPVFFGLSRLYSRKSEISHV